MTKYQFLIRDTAGRGSQAFRTCIFDEWLPAALALNPAGLKIGITDIPLPKLTVLPLRKDNLALISIWLNDKSLPEAWAKTFSGAGLLVHGYRIEESTPVAYDRTWPDGAQSPGVVLLTLLKKNSKLSHAEFMHEWHGRHTPKAMRIHPFWNYIRNVITEPVMPHSPAFQGIVEEHFRSREDCLNPVRMFGGALRFIPNMLEVGLHARYFLDLKTTENYLISETHIRSLV